MSAAGSVLPWSLVFLISFRTRGQDAASNFRSRHMHGSLCASRTVSVDNTSLTIQISFSERVDLEFYKNYPVINYEFEILNSDGSEYNFVNSTGVYFKLFFEE